MLLDMAAKVRQSMVRQHHTKVTLILLSAVDGFPLTTYIQNRFLNLLKAVIANNSISIIASYAQLDKL
jgi:hypothetical protein